MNPNDNSLLYTEGEQPPKSSATSKGALIVVVFLVALVSGWFLYSLFADQQPVEQISNTPDYTEALAMGEKIADIYKSESAPLMSEGAVAANFGFKEEEPTPISGAIIVSAKRFGNDASPYEQLYALDLVATSSNHKLLFSQQQNQFRAMAEFIDGQNPTNLFVLATSAQSIAEEGDKVGIHFFDVATGELRPFKSTQGINERNLEWSEKAGLLAFNRMKLDDAQYVDLLLIENWEIAVINPATDEVVFTIEEASQPKWSPDGTKLMFLKTDGLYVFDVQSKETKKAIGIPEGGLVTTISMIDLSHDGKHLLWTTAQGGIISLYEVTSWDDFAIKAVGRLQFSNTEVFWPLFSPDNKHFAVQAIDTLVGDDLYRKNPRIEIRSLTSSNALYSYTIHDFDFDQLFTDAWLPVVPE